MTLEAAIARAPGEAELHGNLSGLLLAAGRAAEAEAAARRALGIAPGEARFETNLAYARKEQGDFAGALVHLRRAIALDPQDADAHWNLGLTLLAAPATPADEAEGWRALEWRHRIPGLGVTPAAALASTPVWAGEPLAGRTLLLQAEQGLGDTLQLARYARAAKALAGAGAVVLECQPPLERLLRRCAGVDTVVARGRRRRRRASICASGLFSAPGYLGGAAPGGSPPRAVPDRRARAHRALARRGWPSAPRARASASASAGRAIRAIAPTARRSIPLAFFAPLAAADRGRRWRGGEPAKGRRPPAAGGAAVRDLGGRRRARARRRRRVRRHRGADDRARPGDHLGHVDPAPGGRAGRAGLDGARGAARLALGAARRRRAPGIRACGSFARRRPATGPACSARIARALGERFSIAGAP